MYPIDILWNNKRAIAGLQAGFVEYFEKKYDIKLTAKPAEAASSASSFEVKNFCLMRFSSSKLSSAFPIGLVKPEFREKLVEIALGGGESAEGIEKDLAKVVFQVVTTELKNMGTVIDPKTMLCLNYSSLSGWGSVMVKSAIKLGFQAPDFDFDFLFPIFDRDYYRHHTKEVFGFSEEARMLVVDDSATSRKLSSHALNLAGFMNVDECVDGDAAFRKLISSSPQFDLLVADWHMPNLSGIELLKRIRQDAQLNGIPVILATGEQKKEEVANAIKEGVSAYVVKPFPPEVLATAMKRAATWKANFKKKAA